MSSNRRIVVGLTGASGMIYATRLVEALLLAQCDVHLVASPTAVSVLAHEMNLNKNIDFPAMLRSAMSRKTAEFKFTCYPCDNFSAKIASGSFHVDGMVIVPCSGGSLAAVASGVNRHLIHRAAEVQLKERRKLILVLRESPYSLVHIENMATVTRAGGIILPASPPFYHRPESIMDLADALIARILDQLGVDHQLDSTRYTLNV